jgi:hypothetical protein
VNNWKNGPFLGLCICIIGFFDRWQKGQAVTDEAEHWMNQSASSGLKISLCMYIIEQMACFGDDTTQEG